MKSATPLKNCISFLLLLPMLFLISLCIFLSTWFALSFMSPYINTPVDFLSETIKPFSYKCSKCGGLDLVKRKFIGYKCRTCNNSLSIFR